MKTTKCFTLKNIFRCIDKYKLMKIYLHFIDFPSDLSYLRKIFKDISERFIIKGNNWKSAIHPWSVKVFGEFDMFETCDCVK